MGVKYKFLDKMADTRELTNEMLNAIANELATSNELKALELDAMISVHKELDDEFGKRLTHIILNRGIDTE